jgi:hypothetical protein
VVTKVKNITSHKLIWPDYTRTDGSVLELEPNEEALIEQRPVRSNSLRVVSGNINKLASSTTDDEKELGGE